MRGTSTKIVVASVYERLGSPRLTVMIALNIYGIGEAEPLAAGGDSTEMESARRKR
jgi:hypothetical protein